MTKEVLVTEVLLDIKDLPVIWRLKGDQGIKGETGDRGYTGYQGFTGHQD